MKKKIDYTELIAGLSCVAISILAYVSTLGNKSFATTVGVKSTDIPRWCAYLMFALGVGITCKFIVPALKHNPPMMEVEDSEGKAYTEEEKKKKIYQKITGPVTLLLIAIYIFLMKYIGFTISSVIYLTAQITLLSMDTSKKAIVKHFIIALVSSIVIYLLFVLAFKMILPVNSLGF